MANRIHWELSQWCVSWYWNSSFGWIIFLMAYFSRHQLKFLAQIILLLLSFFISVGQEQETVKDNTYSSCKASRWIEKFDIMDHSVKAMTSHRKVAFSRLLNRHRSEFNSTKFFLLFLKLLFVRNAFSRNPTLKNRICLLLVISREFLKFFLVKWRCHLLF